MQHAIQVAPSILSADTAALGREIGRIANADLVHVDVMDGHFVPNLSYGTPIVRACKRSTDIPLDVHLMVTNPDDAADWYADAGADLVTVHVEASTHLHRTVRHLKDRGVRAGAALNPATPVSALEEILPELDLVLVMSVNPGFGGQSFIPSTLGKLHRLRALCARVDAHPLIEVDGGVSVANAEDVAAAGADVLVAGSAVFGADDPASAVDAIRKAGERGLSRRDAR